MATCLKLQYPTAGLTYIYNVSGHVGPYRANENKPDDVELVQFLLREILKLRAGTTVFNTYPSVTRKIDVITAYWIIRLQDDNSDDLKVDGIVSPARGLEFASGRAWTIAVLNYEYKKLYGADAFARIPQNPELSPSLRQSLQHP